MKQEKTSTTLKRFSLSLLEKFSVYPELISILLQNEVLSWAIIVLSSFDNEEFDIFMINYTTALFLNFLLHLTGGKIDEANLKEIVPGGAEFVSFF